MGTLTLATLAAIRQPSAASDAQAIAPEVGEQRAQGQPDMGLRQRLSGGGFGEVQWRDALGVA
jgi:hypothetical protein